MLKCPNTGVDLIHNSNRKCNDKNNSGKKQNVIKSTKTASPTGSTGATKIAQMGDSFMYIETIGNNYGPHVYCSFARTDNIQISNITV